MAFPLAKSIALLERTPTILNAWLAGLPPIWIHANEGPNTWSPFDIVGHLIHGEETDWIPRIKKILRGGQDAVFEPFDRFGFEANAGEDTIESLLDRFAQCRSASVQELRAMDLGPSQFALCGQHPEFGSVRLDQLLAAWTAHDLAHFAQVSRVMAKVHADAVGPWRKYLPIVNPLE